MQLLDLDCKEIGPAEVVAVVRVAAVEDIAADGMVVGITLPTLLLKEVDKVRGDIPRSMYIRRAVEQYTRKSGGSAWVLLIIPHLLEPLGVDLLQGP